MKEKKLTELNKEEILTILKQRNWYNSLNTKISLEYLGIKSKDIVRINANYSTYERNLIMNVLEEYLVKNKYTIDKKIDMTCDDVYPLRYFNLTVGLDKYKKVMYDGSIFISKGNERHILEIEPCHKSWSFDVTSSIKFESKAIDLLNGVYQYAKKYNLYKNKKITPNLEFIKYGKYVWDDLIMDDKIKKQIQNDISLVLDNSEIFSKNNISVKRGLILKGKPGTGKTLLGKILCNTINSTFIWVTPKHFLSGEGVSRILNIARDLSPVVLLLEDIDLYSKNRHVSQQGDLLGELMNQLDGLVENNGVIVIATTNDITSIEDAIQNRPGRFDKKYTFNIPDEKERKLMIEKFSNKMILKNINIDDLVKKVKGLTGAHVRELIKSAAISAVADKSYTKQGIIIIKEKYLMDNFSHVKQKEMTVVGFSIQKNEEDDDD